MIKTQTKAESAMLRSILPDYVSFMFENPHSFLTHFYGMYRVTMPDLGHKIHFVIMKSVFNTEKEIHKIYDLKGSTVGRRAKRGDSVHKDLDILDEGWKIRVGHHVKKAMMEQLRRDTNFLVHLRIMDYSLLLGLHVQSSDTDHVHQEDPITDPSSSPTKIYRPEILRSNTPLTRQLSQLEAPFDGNLALCHEEDDSKEKDECKAIDDRTDPHDDRQDDIPDDEGGFHDPHPFDESDDDTSPQISLHMMNSISSTDFFEAAQNAEPVDEIPNERNNSGLFPGERLIEPVRSHDSFKSDQPCNGNPFTSRDDSGIPSYSPDGISTSREIYFMGIIDILQYYTTRKWGETIVKKAAGNSEADISCVDPVTYANRFIDFMGSLIE